MFVTSFAGSVSTSERDQQKHTNSKKVIAKNKTKHYNKFCVVLTTYSLVNKGGKEGTLCRLWRPDLCAALHINPCDRPLHLQRGSPPTLKF